MKYDKEMYIDSGIYGCDEDIACHKEKVVKCRKPHVCASCEKEIKVGDQALSESGFIDGEAVSSDTCLDCVEEWLKESGQIDMDDEEKE